MKRIGWILLLAACASAPPPKPAPATPPSPRFTNVPGSVVDALCVRLHEEGFASDQAIDVVSTTRPLITPQTLEALSQKEFYKGRVNREALAAAAATNETPLPIGKGHGGCALHGIAAEAPRSIDTMLLELSAPFTLPFGRGADGVLARFSLGGDSATWYWIPIISHDGAWIAGRAEPLAVH